MGAMKVTNGMFGWTDLSVPDPDQVKGFYQELFGWTSTDIPMGDAGPYTIFQKDGHDIAGLSRQPPEQSSAGVPPLWNSYITVDDVDAVTEKAGGLGAQVLMPPFDAMDVGRMSVIQDPTGGVVCLWEDRSGDSKGFFNEHGTMTWNELATRDQPAAAEFYGSLLGWAYDDIDSSAGPYKVIMNEGRPNGGILQMNHEWPDAIPPHWMVYFAVDDVAVAAEAVERLGGSISVPPTDIQVGVMSVVGDPAGGTFTLFKANPTPDEG